MRRIEIDGGTVEVINSYLLSAAEQMRRTLIRTAFNPVIYSVLDFGISMYNSDIEPMAEAPGITSFMGANDYALPRVIEYVGKENLKSGDVVLLNYPYWNSAHSYDAMLFAPVFHKQEKSPAAYLAVRAHWMDLGAKDPGYVLDSTNMHQEGLIFPGTKIVKQGIIDHEIIELIRFNSRLPDLTIGDFHAQLAALRVGERQLHELWEKFDRKTVDAAVSTVKNSGEAAAWRALKGIPNGIYKAEDWLDDDGITEDPILMSVVVTVSEGGMTVDYSSSSKSVPGPVNLPFGATQSMARTAFKLLTTPELPTNSGHYVPLTVLAKPGTLFHAEYPSSTFTQWTTMSAFELIFKALSGVISRLPASSGSDEPGFMALGNDPRTGTDFVISNNEGVGWGGNPKNDGASGQMHLSLNIVRNTQIELLENKATLHHEKLELVMDSGGAGLHRGGQGIRRVVRFTSNGEVLSMKKKTQTYPWGAQGGLSPMFTNSMVVWPNTDKAKSLRMRREKMQQEDVFENISAGGGGWGNPLERPVELVVEDVENYKVSLRSAQELYGIHILPTGEIQESKERQLHNRALPSN